MYVATVTLRRSEREFWRMAPRKLHALVEEHVKINGSDKESKKDKPKQGFIDQVF